MTTDLSILFGSEHGSQLARLGVDIMTGHWEFTYQDREVLENIAAFNGEFVAQNIRVTEDALFEGASAFDEDTGHAFKPYTVREVGARRIAVIGQAFPYTPIANPSRSARCTTC